MAKNGWTGRPVAAMAARPVARPRHAVSYARGANGKYVLACTCAWWTDVRTQDQADRAARAHLLAGR